MPREFNYWLTTVQMSAAPAEPLPESADVAIIGAGFTGLSAALALAKRGAKVVVLEAEPSAGARARGMAHGAHRTEAARRQQLISMYGRELTAAHVRRVA